MEIPWILFSFSHRLPESAVRALEALAERDLFETDVK